MLLRDFYTPPLCGVSHIGEVAQSDGGVNSTKILYVIFPPPLIVATASLFLPYILLCKTQRRSVNTFDNRSRAMHLPLPLAVPRNVMGHGKGGGKTFNQKLRYIFYTFIKEK